MAIRRIVHITNCHLQALDLDVGIHNSPYLLGEFTDYYDLHAFPCRIQALHICSYAMENEIEFLTATCFGERVTAKQHRCAERVDFAK